jgi:hypothetical protein
MWEVRARFSCYIWCMASSRGEVRAPATCMRTKLPGTRAPACRSECTRAPCEPGCWECGDVCSQARACFPPRRWCCVGETRSPRSPSLSHPLILILPYPSFNPLLLPDTTLMLALTRTPLHRRSKPPSTASASCTRRSTSLRRPLSPPGPRLKRASSAWKALRGEVWGTLPGALPLPAIMGRMRGIQGQGQGGEGEALAVQRLRRTALGLVGAFFLPPPLPVHATNTPLRRTDTCAGYFTTRAPDALLPLLQYVLGALADADGGFVWRCVFL